MNENLDFEELDFLLETPQALSQNDINVDLHVQRNSPTNRQSLKKRRRLAERIAENDELVRQLRQLQGNQQQLKDLQRTAGEVTELYQREKQLRTELESRVNAQSERCADLEKQLDVQQLNCEQLQEELKTRALPVDSKDMVTIFLQLAQRVGEDSHASGLLRREHNMLRKLKDYCKLEKISIPSPTIKSPASKRIRVTAATAQATQTTQTNPLHDLQVTVPSKPEMCSIAVQSECLVSTRNQGTQHKNTTTTRGTTTASFIKKHDVGTCFPEPKPALSAQQILDKMLSWNNSFITPLSPISDPQPETVVLRTASMGTCTELCNVQREIDYLPELPAELKRSNSRPPSRASVKDELAMPVGAAGLGGYGHHMAKELANFLPQSQSILANLPPHVFEEIWQVMGQMVQVVLQRHSINSSLGTSKPTTSAPTISQADFSSWFDALYENSLNQPQASNKEDAEFEVPLEEATSIDVGTDPIMAPPPEIGLELTPIRLLAKPKFRVLSKPKPKKRRRRVIINKRAPTKRQAIASKVAGPTETAVQFLSNLTMFKNPNCDNLDIQLDAEERQLLQLTSAEEISEQHSPVAPCEEDHQQSTSSTSLHADDSDHRQPPPLECEKYPPQSTPPLECEEDPPQSRPTSPCPKEESTLLFDMVEGQPPSFECEDNSPQIPTSSTRKHHSKLSIEIDSFSDDGQQPPLECEENLLQSRPTSSSRNEQAKLLFGSDGDSDDDNPPPLECKEDPPQISYISSSHKEHCNLLLESDGNSSDGQHSLFTDKEDLSQSRPTSSSREEGNILLINSAENSDNEQHSLLINPSPTSSDNEGSSDDVEPQLLNIEQICQPISIGGNDSDVDSIDSYSLVIDDGNLQCNNENSEAVQLPESIVTSPVGKRKRKTSSSSSWDHQPVEKRLTRWQAKQLLLESEFKANIDNAEPIKLTIEPQSSCITSCSPMSPVAVASCEESDSELIEIPLEQPGGNYSASEPKALLSCVVNEVKAKAKKCGQRKQKQPINSRIFQLQLNVVNYLKDLVPLDSTWIELITEDETAAIAVIITAFGEVQEDSALDRLLTVIKQIECLNYSFIERFMNTLEQRLFSIKERLSGLLAQKYVRLYLQLTGLQGTLIVPGQSYVNPARLLLAKILYHYNNDMTLLVLEVLCHFPTVLPHREERDYDHTDPLITVIKHLLMSHKYEMQDAQGPDRALLSKLRFEYHFQPFEPTKQQVIENLVEKLKAGRLHQLCYAFALFCRRSAAIYVTKDVLEAQLLPLANSYCDLCLQSEAYDARVECLLQSISMIVKQLPLDNKMDISDYIAFFKRLLVAVPRPGVQEAAVQAILRTQRFGFGFALYALRTYRPNYQLSPMTRTMMRSFAERRLQFQQPHKVTSGQKVVNKKQSIR